MAMTRGSPTQESEQFETLDIMSAAWLVIHGHTPRFRKDDSKIMLVFAGSEKLYQDLTSYTRGEKCNANQFATTFKTLKGRVLSLKQEDGDGRYVYTERSNPKT